MWHSDQGRGGWGGSWFFPDTERLRLTFSGKVKLSGYFAVTVLDAATIDALILLTGLGDGQGHRGVITSTTIGDVNI